VSLEAEPPAAAPLNPQPADIPAGAKTAPVQYDRGVLNNNRRLINFAGFAACVIFLGYALYAQYHLGLEPCPLCIFQRIGTAALGIVFLLAAIQNPRGWGARVYAFLIGLAALATIAVAARQVYIQHLPPGSVPSCGAPLEVLLKFTPVIEVIRKVLTGSGECGEVNWTFLGLAMPAWVAIYSVILGVAGVAANSGRPSRLPQ
jgi:protein dithiol:quinone oxidoreductase